MSGHPALDQFFVEEFGGVLLSDFWAAYDAVGRIKQKCWPHAVGWLRDQEAGPAGQVTSANDRRKYQFTVSPSSRPSVSNASRSNSWGDRAAFSRRSCSFSASTISE